MPPESPVDPRFVELPAAGGAPLAGLLYEAPEGVAPVASVLYIHGKGGNFYSGPPRAVPVALASSGAPVRQLSLNMRCHDLGYTRGDVPYRDFAEGGALVDGGFWEDLSTGWQDLDVGVDFLRAGSSAPVLIAGHSSGGFFVADYCARRPDVGGRVLLSPLVSNKRPFQAWFGEGQIDAAVARAEELVASGHGDHLIPTNTWYYAVAATSLLERANEPDDIWAKNMAAARSPVLCVVGGAESRVAEWRQLVEDLPAEHKRFVVIEGAEHNYIGHADEVAKAITAFAVDVAGSSS